MNKFESRVANHPFNESLKTIKVELQAFAAEKLSPEYVEELERLSLAIGYMEDKILTSNKTLVSRVILNSIHTSIDSSLAELRQYPQTKDPSVISRANKLIDQALPVAAQLPVLHDNISVAKVIELLNEKQSSLDALAKEKMNSLDVELNRTAGAIEAVEKDLAGVRKILTEEQRRITGLGSGFQDQFSKAQEARITAFGQTLSKLNEDIAAFKAGMTDEVNSVFTQRLKDVSKIADDVLTQLNLKNSNAAKLLESVGASTHTYDYAAVSETEGRSAKNLRRIAVGLMITAVVLLIVPPIFHLINDIRTGGTETNWTIIWEQTLYRLPTVLVIFIPAFYLAREAAQHRKVEVENKRIQLELAALNPFIAQFDAREQFEMRKQLLAHYFIGHSVLNRDETGDKYRELFDGLAPRLFDKFIENIGLGGGDDNVRKVNK